MLPRLEFILWLIEVASRKGEVNYTRLHKIIYILDKQLLQRYNKNLGYEFDTFLPHTGPYDTRLQEDLDNLTTLHLIKNRSFPFANQEHNQISTRDIKVVDTKKAYVNNVLTKELLKAFGGRDELKWIEKRIAELMETEERDLVREACKQYIAEHPDSANYGKLLLPAIKTT